MNERVAVKGEAVEVDIWRLMSAIWHGKWMIALVAVLSAVLTYLGSCYLVTPLYQSSAMFYVNNTAFSVGDAALSISAGDISAAKSLVNSYIVILQTRESLNEVIELAEVSLTYEDLEEMIVAASVDTTEVFEVIVTSEDPYEAERIASAITQILPSRISHIIEGTSARIVDTAVIPSKPSFPNSVGNAIIGFLLGASITASIIILREVFDFSIRSEEDITDENKYPVLATVPDMTASVKKDRYGYGKRGKDGARTASVANKQEALVGENISFETSEAYKLLRTKIRFSFTDGKTCHVIGLSSALAGEGKSLTAANLAYVLSELDVRVLLIDCDMRRPSLPEKLQLATTPGLSGFLSGHSELEEIIRPCKIRGSEQSFSVIAAGRIPPNPVELLSSAKMTEMLEGLRKEYDYIVLDLPPVEEVSDALAVARKVDGMLLVVRQNYCKRTVFSSTVRQFEFAGTNLLGIVFNGVSEAGKTYRRKYSKKYYAKKKSSP